MKPDYREIFNECHWMTYYAWKHADERRKENEQKTSKEDSQSKRIPLGLV